MKLQAEQELLGSPVVANCRMNRERGIAGVNSYAKELKLDIVDFLTEKARQGTTVHWLDICCGSGKALLQAAMLLREKGVGDRVKIEGWDLAGLFVTPDSALPDLQLIARPIGQWQPPHAYDLITCVHGLHYIGDKLGLVVKCLANLTEDGTFVGNLDLKSLKKLDGGSWDRHVAKMLREASVHYHARNRLVTAKGKKVLSPGLTYEGADDGAGKNYTGQEAVHSYYRLSR